MTMRKSHRKHPDPNQEYVFDDSGREIAVIRDGATMHVSLLDAMAARGEHMTYAEQRLTQYDEWQRHSYYNKPGFRTYEQILGDSAEGKAARQRVADANLEYERRVTSAYRQDNIFEENTDRFSKPPTGAGASQFIGAREGDLCTINGWPGRLRPDENGSLQCVADHDPQNDHRSLADKMEAHSLRMQEEYEDYCRRQSDAWKTLR
jgi:hypothetical protein